MVTSGSTRSACMKTGRQSSDMKLAKARQDCEKLIVHVFFKIRFDCVYCRSSTALCTVTSWHGGGSGSTLGCARILIVCHVLRIISRTGKSVRHLCSLWPLSPLKSCDITQYKCVHYLLGDSCEILCLTAVHFWRPHSNLPVGRPTPRQKCIRGFVLGELVKLTSYFYRGWKVRNISPRCSIPAALFRKAATYVISETESGPSWRFCVFQTFGVVRSAISEKIGLLLRPWKNGQEKLLNLPACCSAYSRQNYIA